MELKGSPAPTPAAGPVRCAIFDCDGTLVDSELLGNQALEQALAPHGIAESALALTQRYRGGRLDHILRDLEDRHGARLPDGFVAGYRSRAARLFESALRPIPSVESALEALPLALCVASNGPVAKTAASLRITDLDRFFGDRLFSAYVVEAWKPAPDLFLHAADRMGFAPAECVVVEDSAVGVEAAWRAGMRALWYRPDRDAAPAGPATPGVIEFTDMAALAPLILSMS